jgi:Melibiase
MQLGLWGEPEMVNPDSDLARAYPDWILATGGRLPPLSRSQHVLDLAHPEAYAYILERLDALLRPHARRGRPARPGAEPRADAAAAGAGGGRRGGRGRPRAGRGT